ncbi:MAG: hypothetical protein COV08_00565 [Candidatus Vogelbacteria bacterium CG10_big_fil_rev_8_21_14_0_10_49_38]|uniref:ComEC/Rec2-related protein domain-containing protein n=1 Tax=Candidatus Vogelbacteria bacterium CG10_big_fil_rev_8_21_14_0_10_49_38 TaxID=1975043 RepID=A0A2H0RIM6_9BACT|nr:MAG: hypothetical protein BK006_00570 [bacterium CG10_49_38]PIR46411.1 MAG: hypothetical protein COV08_00565 [Candidatus Vogelbacteria bacterium CG10_big_fil_rev_8_21_14_0_10_49_38]
MAKLRAATLYLVGGFAFGVAWGGAVGFDWSVAGLVLLLSLAWASLFIIKRQKLFLIFALVALGALFGLIRFAWADRLSLSLDQVCLPATKVDQLSCEGLVVSDPDRRDLTTRLVVQLDGEQGDLSGRWPKVLVTVDNFTNYAYGDRLVISGRWQKPENFLTETGRVFDYQNYLAARDITQVVYHPKIEILARGEGWTVKAWLFKLKHGFLANLRRALPEPSATLGGGLLLGDRGGLGEQTEENFRRAGLSHLVVLSGYNITIVADNMLRFGAWLWPAGSWLFGVGAVLLFVIMTGGEASVVRAALMGSIALVARRYGRPYEASIALLVAGFLMVLWQPRLLVFDLGFQLSFLATLGLIYLSPWVDRQLKRVKFKFGGLREIVSTTMAAQLAVYPWLLYKTGNATLIGFVSNIFALPVIPWAMFLSFLTGLAGFVAETLAVLAGYPTYLILWYVLAIAERFS